MSQLDPPPRIIEKFTRQWRDWLYFTWEFISDSASSLTSHIGLTNWNAHGNTATGDATTPLKIDAGSLWVDGTTGDTPTSGAGTRLMYIPSKGGAFRSGSVTGTQWDAANIGLQSVAFGLNSQASGANSVSFGGNASGSSSFAGPGGTASGSSAVALGNASSSSGFLGSIAIGDANSTGVFTLAIGNDCDANIANSVGIGVSAKATSAVSVALGQNITASASGAVAFGTGPSPVNNFVNNKANSMMLGANINSATQNATLTLVAQKCGVENESPLSTLDIGGSVGFQYDIITATNGGSSTLSDEYVVLVNMAGVTGSNNYTVNLPALGASTIDRRVYYIKTISPAGTWSGTSNLVITPDASDQIENIDSGSANAGSLKTAGTSLTLSMAGGSGFRGASLTFVADNTSGGWWLI